MIVGLVSESSAPLQVGSSCAELECPAPLECVERITKGTGSIAKCTITLQRIKEATDRLIDSMEPEH